MLQGIFHAWERRLAAATTDRVVRPFEWGLDWIGQNGHPPIDPADRVAQWVSEVMSDTDRFYTPAPTTAYTVAPVTDTEDLLTFPSAMDTPHPENNTVYARLFRPARARRDAARAAVLVLPQWNSDPNGHV